MDKPKFEYMFKFDGQSKWRPLSDHFFKQLLKAFFPDEYPEQKILDLKFGHSLNIRDLSIEAWHRDKDN